VVTPRAPGAGTPTGAITFRDGTTVLGTSNLSAGSATFQPTTLSVATHQITAVYEEMLPRQPLRYLLADDPGAGKTIMAGLYIREMLMRRVIGRVLIVPPAGLVGNWQRELARHGLSVTPVRDRQYFHSIYFREPGGVLFEIATDPPGFAIDEDPDHLGEALRLPPQHEHLRERLERSLTPLSNPRVTTTADLELDAEAGEGVERDAP